MIHYVLSLPDKLIYCELVPNLSRLPVSNIYDIQLNDKHQVENVNVAKEDGPNTYKMVFYVDVETYTPTPTIGINVNSQPQQLNCHIPYFSANQKTRSIKKRDQSKRSINQRSRLLSLRTAVSNRKLQFSSRL
ncbi:hypothetical protein RCL1_003462 [Eukaryota sp. TZLM3-RCL]